MTTPTPRPILRPISRRSDRMSGKALLRNLALARRIRDARLARSTNA